MNIFICYRRSDSDAFVGRLYESLSKEFGQESVFRDVFDISPGADFRIVIGNQIKKSGVVLVVIGKKWALNKDVQENKGINNPTDFVRIEIESALLHHIPIIPIYIDGEKNLASMLLPNSIAASLPYLNAVKIRTGQDYLDDVRTLIQSISPSKISELKQNQYPASLSSKNDEVSQTQIMASQDLKTSDIITRKDRLVGALFVGIVSLLVWCPILVAILFSDSDDLGVVFLLCGFIIIPGIFSGILLGINKSVIKFVVKNIIVFLIIGQIISFMFMVFTEREISAPLESLAVGGIIFYILFFLGLPVVSIFRAISIYANKKKQK